MPSSASGLSISAFFCILFTPSLLSAQSSPGVGERAQGMAGAFVAVADDATAAYWNPAGLANVFKFDAQLGGGTDTVFAGASMPALGLSYYQTRTGVSGSGSRQNEGSGQVHVSSISTRNAGVTLVQTLVNGAVVGSTLRFVNGGGHSGFDVDAGFMASVGVVRAGLSARNLVQAVDTRREIRLGVALVPRSLPAGLNGPFSLAVDVDLTKPALPEIGRRVAVGSEQWWAKGRFATRAGVNWSTADAAQPAFSGGFTVRLPAAFFGEGHVTKSKQASDTGWGAGLRYAF